MSLDLNEQYDKIYRYCYFRLQNREIAEDITQETFLRYLEHAKYQDEKALRYLYTIARNLCIDEYRRKKTEELSDDYAQDFGEEKLLSKMAVSKVLEKLPSEERELLLLRYANDLQVAVIAQILGISRFTVRRRIHRAVKNFKKELEKEGIHE